jgi:hypothetical protein
MRRAAVAQQGHRKKLICAIAVASCPEAFGDGERIYAESLGGKGWLLDGHVVMENPRLFVGPGEADMLVLWRQYAPRPGRIAGMAAGLVPVTGHLPEAGGLGDQAAIMIDAFEIMSAAQQRLDAHEGR